MVEQAMFFLAGLLVAGLAGVMVAPAFARRASRLSAARARMLAPLSMKEVVAERDMLRAAHAVEQHHLERRIATLQDAVARRRADLGRQAAILVALESGTADRRAEIADLRADLAARQREILGLEGDLGASRIVLNDFSARLDRASWELTRLREERLAIGTLTDEQRSVIAGLEMRASALEMKLDDAAQAAKAEAIAAETERARLSSALNSQTSEVVRLSGELGEAKEKSAVLFADNHKANAELQQARQRVLELEAELTSRERAFEGASIETGRRHANGAARGQAPVDADDIRRDPGFRSQGDLALREAISRLAADVARLSGASGDCAAPLPNPGNSKRRESRALPSQGPDTTKGVTPAHVRQLQPMARER